MFSVRVGKPPNLEQITVANRIYLGSFKSLWCWGRIEFAIEVDPISGGYVQTFAEEILRLARFVTNFETTRDI